MPRITGCAWSVVAGRPGGLRRRILRRIMGRGSAGPPAPAPAPAESPPPVAEPASQAPDPAFVDVISAADIAPGRVVEVTLAGTPVAIANVDGQYFAIAGECPHAGGPLGDGALAGRVLTCPNHGWTFDVTTGRCLIDPAISVTIVPVRVVGGRIGLRVPAAW